MADLDKKNIRAHETIEIMWDPTNSIQSLRDVRKAVEVEAQKGIDWYWRKKEWKRIPSRYVQFSAFALTALGGLASIIITLLKQSGVPGLTNLDSGTIATLCIGIAAALFGLDKTFGYSTGWTRYVLTATSMTKLLREFRMDWVSLVATAANPPTPEQISGLLQRTKEFVSSVQNMTMKETQDWATEFQSNMAQMERDIKGQLDTLKAQVDNAAKAKEAALKPGAIELTVANADKADNFAFQVTLEGVTATSAEPVKGGKVWTSINVTPGHYKMTVKAQLQSKDISTSAVVEVKPGEIAKVSSSLPIP